MASRSVNKAILLGRLGKDAETRFTPSGVARTTFSIATSRRWKDQQTGEWKEETDWHNIVLWRSENVSSYLTKGKQVYIEGRMQSRSYDDKDGNKRYITEVVADDGEWTGLAEEGTGLSIVRALVHDELGGTLTLGGGPGLRAEVRFPA